jgi:hypothetical protein|tara:strand:- start:3764 stop:6574 length:2811 start_codon:yes stop_codon:yes gene_type:complete
MGLITQSIPTLLRGVSQASDTQKQADHAWMQSNFVSSPTEGLKKRSGAQYVATLQSSTMGNVHIQTINRDETEGYIAVFGDQTLAIFDSTTGAAIGHEVPDGASYLDTDIEREEIKTVSIADYTFVLNVNKTVAMAADVSAGANNGALVFFNQVSDKTSYTITVNSTVATHDTSSDNPLSTTTVGTKIKDKLLGQNGESPSSGSALSGFTIQQNGPVLWIKKDDSTDFTIDSNDTQGNSQITLVKSSIQNFTDLPVVAPNNFVVEVKGSDSTKFDNHYVKFVTNNGGTFEQGQWEETLKPGIQYKYDYSTMPHVLIRKSDGLFIFAQADGGNYTLYDKTGTYSQANNVVTVTSTNHGLSTGNQIALFFKTGSGINTTTAVTVTNANTFTYNVTDGNFASNADVIFGVPNTQTLPKWSDRTVGDLDTAPNPSFVGQKLNNIFFFRNRIGFLADDDVILSRVSDFFNFFPETVTTVLDSDPIDIAASHTEISILKHATTMGEELILFSEKAQFILKASDDTLTPKTAYIVVATEFNSNTKAKPVSSGNSVYFLTQKGEYSGVREYIKQPGVEVKDASDITIHVPKYIPGSVFKMTTSSSENLLALLPNRQGAFSGTNFNNTSTQDESSVFINRWLYGENFNKVLNSWFELNLYLDYKILNIDFIGSDLFLVVESATETVLLKLPFESRYVEPHAPGGESNGCEFHLDFKVTEATTGVSITYDSNTKLSTFTFPYKLYGTPTIVGRFLDDGLNGGTAETSTYVDSKGNTKTLQTGQTIQTSTIAYDAEGTTSVVTATGDYRNSKVIMGYTFGSLYVFPPQKLIDEKTNAPILGGRFQLLNFYLKYERTASFETFVKPSMGEWANYKFTPNLLGVRYSTGSTGSGSQPLNRLRTQKGVFKFPVMSKADMNYIDIWSLSFLPAQFLSAEYEAMYHSRSRRI